MVKGKDIVVWFSCGAASAVAAKVTLDKYGQDNNVRIVNNPIKEEHVDKHVATIVKLMETAASLNVPLVVEAGVGNNWDEAH